MQYTVFLQVRGASENPRRKKSHFPLMSSRGCATRIENEVLAVLRLSLIRKQLHRKDLIKSSTAHPA